MIRLTRRGARHLRAAFRRHPLGLPRKGPAPPLVLQAGPGGTLLVRLHRPGLAVELALPHASEPALPLAIPLDALADFEGPDDATITLEPSGAGHVAARWADRGIPRLREYGVPDPAGLPAFPAAPDRFEPCPAGLLDALAEAAEATDAGSTRYALGCLRLRGGPSGDVAATDGRQLYVRGGFALPWDGDVLVRPVPLLASPELPRERIMGIGCAGGHVVLRVGPWTLWLAEQEGRFPRVDDVLPAEAAITTRLHLDPGDARFLADALDRLPGVEGSNAPVTLDCNGRVAIRARGEGEGAVTELVLARSRYEGEPAWLHTDRRYLARALGLGLAEIGIAGVSLPAAARSGTLLYGWQPLPAEAAFGPADDAIVVASTDRDAGPIGDATRTDSARSPMRHSTDRDITTAGPDPNPATPGAPRPIGLADLIAEAEAHHAALGEAKARAAPLVAALRRHRKRHRQMESTLAALKQLQLAEAGA